jgi:hypothetical protein
VQRLLDLLEEDLDIPARLVQIADAGGGSLEVVREFIQQPLHAAQVTV